MDSTPRFLVVVPVYNHALTVRSVVRGAMRLFPVLAVDDGSTDGTTAVLSEERDLRIITLPTNEGKAAALKRGFAEALALGFTHAITIDADGQHPVDALGAFAALSREHPRAFVIGVRDLKAAGAPWARRFSNALSTWCFRLETGVRLGDTQCGLRVYPLLDLKDLRVQSERYAYELEIMVRAAWAAVPLISCPIQVDYQAPTSRMSHFHPLYDFAQVSRAHLRLLAEFAVLRRARGATNTFSY